MAPDRSRSSSNSEQLILPGSIIFTRGVDSENAHGRPSTWLKVEG